jgi:hypothetical protein
LLLPSVLFFCNLFLCLHTNENKFSGSVKSVIKLCGLCFLYFNNI